MSPSHGAAAHEEGDRRDASETTPLLRGRDDEGEGQRGGGQGDDRQAAASRFNLRSRRVTAGVSGLLVIIAIGLVALFGGV